MRREESRGIWRARARRWSWEISTRRRLRDSIDDVVWAVLIVVREEEDLPLLVASSRGVENDEGEEEDEGIFGGAGVTGNGPEIVIPAMVIVCAAAANAGGGA